MGKLRSGILLVCALLLACAAPANEIEAPKSNILVISIDTLRADHLGCYGYFRDTSPVLDALAKESVFFELGLTPLATTLPAHMSLFTGTHPIEHGILANVNRGKNKFVRPESLRPFAEFARERGYRTAGVVSAAPVSSPTGIAVGFDDYREMEGHERIAADTNADVFEWLDTIGPEPFFLWVHYFDPHSPYKPPPSHAGMFETDAELEAHIAARRMPASVVRPNRKRMVPRTAINNYDAEIRYVDEQVGKLFARLRAAGLWDKTVTVVLSDHGEGLGEHGMAGHGYIHREQIHVPLMIRVPGRSPERIAAAVSLVDVLPTTIGLLDETDHPAWQGFLKQASGRDLLDDSTKPEPVLTRRSARVRDDVGEVAFALSTREWKYVHEPKIGNRLFDWLADPLELRNVASAKNAKANQLRNLLLELVERYEKRHAELVGEDAAQESEMDPELLEKLRSLGYID